MNPEKTIHDLIARDQAFLKVMERPAGSICPGCGRHTFVGYYPQTHVKRRSLCEHCGADYIRLLASLGFLDQPPKPRPKVFRRRFPLQRKSVRTPPARWRNQPPVIEVRLEPRPSPIMKKIIVCTVPQDFENKCNALIAEGWELIPGFIHSSSSCAIGDPGNLVHSTQMEAYTFVAVFTRSE